MLYELLRIDFREVFYKVFYHKRSYVIYGVYGHGKVGISTFKVSNEFMRNSIVKDNIIITCHDVCQVRQNGDSTK